jgi:putative membrane protein
MLKSVALAFFLVLLALPGFAQATRPNDSSRNTKTGAAQTAGPVAEAIEMNAAEVELGRMASGKAQNARVKEFADMMVKDHGQALSKLRPLQGNSAADIKPNAKHQQLSDRLSKLSGAEFDREYMKAMVAGHQEALRFFEAHSGQGKAVGSNQDFAKVAQELTPTVRQHLQSAQQIEKEIQGGASTSGKSEKSDKKAAATRK